MASGRFKIFYPHKHKLAGPSLPPGPKRAPQLRTPGQDAGSLIFSFD